MHIEKCQITTTETRTRTGWMRPDDVALGIGPYYVWEAGVVGHDIPVTLTYPAPVQVKGVRVEMTDEEASSLLGKLDNYPHVAFHVERIRQLLRRVIDDAQPASPPTQPAPQDAGEFVPYTMETWPKGDGVRIRSGQDTSMLVTRVEHVGISSGVLHLTWHTLAADYELSTDNGATWQPCYQTKQASPLPWHDLGPGLSVAVVEGRGVYQVRPVAGGWVASITEMDGLIAHVSAESTLAAAKAACDAHHAKGGEA